MSNSKKVARICYGISIIIFMIYGFIDSPCLFAQTTAEFWAEWHGPADGTAYIPQAPGPDLHLAWSLDLIDPHDDYSLTDNLGYAQTEIYRSGTLIRADDQWIYLKLNTDYAPLPTNTVWKIDPLNGDRVWSSTKASGEDVSTVRGFQLYDAPGGYKALHAAAFYENYWNVLNVEDYSTVRLTGLSDSHACLGARVLMGNWAWKNNRMVAPRGPTYHHGGRLMWWNGSDYGEKLNEDMVLIDHAHDGNRNVIFVLTGYQANVPYEKARYMILDNGGNVVQDQEITDIYRPNCPDYWRP